LTLYQIPNPLDDVRGRVAADAEVSWPCLIENPKHDVINSTGLTTNRIEKFCVPSALFDPGFCHVGERDNGTHWITDLMRDPSR
jgi:hypothetical protein